jgi:hypothetical protein
VKPATFIPIILCAVVASGSAAQTAEEPLDLAAVTRVEVTGEASMITLTTRDDARYEATIGGRRIGWFSHWYSTWFFNDCATSSRMHIDGSTLIVSVSPSSWMDPSDCRVEIRANVRKDSAVSIEQAAVQARLKGDFSSLDIDSKAADVSLDGRAASLALRGDALRVHLAYAGLQHNETVKVDARALDADLDFGGDTLIDYAVEAQASWVTSSLESSPGAKPSVRIKADMVRATIR